MIALWAPTYMSFQQVLFKRVFKPVVRPVPPNAEIVTAYTNGVVTRRSNRRTDGYHEANDLSTYRGVEPGDFVVHGLDILRGSVGVSDSRGAMSPVCTVCVLLEDDDPRFMAYAIQAQAHHGFTRVMARGIREGGADFRRWETLADLPLPRPAPDVQRKLADYLDSETARIDALIAKKQRLRSLLSQRVRALTSYWVSELASTHGTVALRHLCDGLEQGWSPPCDNVPAQDGETGILMTSSVTSGTFDGAANKRLPSDQVPDVRWRVNVGDVVLARGSGSLARVAMAAVAKQTEAEVYLTDLTFRLRCPRRAPQFLVSAINSPEGRAQIESAVRTDSGQTLKVRADDVLSVRVPAVPQGEDSMAVSRLVAQVSPIEQLDERLNAQVDLMRERRQSLITAAVTGEFGVPGVAA